MRVRLQALPGAALTLLLASCGTTTPGTAPIQPSVVTVTEVVTPTAQAGTWPSEPGRLPAPETGPGGMTAQVPAPESADLSTLGIRSPLPACPAAAGLTVPTGVVLEEAAPTESGAVTTCVYRFTDRRVKLPGVDEHFELTVARDGGNRFRRFVSEFGDGTPTPDGLVAEPHPRPADRRVFGADDHAYYLVIGEYAGATIMLEANVSADRPGAGAAGSVLRAYDFALSQLI